MFSHSNAGQYGGLLGLRPAFSVVFMILRAYERQFIEGSGAENGAFCGFEPNISHFMIRE